MPRELPTNISFSIPYEVMIDTTLNLASRVLYAEVLAMSIKYGYCWASNHHFAQVLGISERTATRSISELIERGYVTVENPNSQGRKLVPLHRQNGEVPRRDVHRPRQSGAVPRQDGELDTIKRSIQNSNKNTAVIPSKKRQRTPEEEARVKLKAQEFADRRAATIRSISMH